MRLNFIVHSLDKKDMGGVAKVVTNLVNLLSQQEGLEVVIYNLGEVHQLAFALDSKVRLITLNLNKHSTVQYRGLFKLRWFSTLDNVLKNILEHSDENDVWLPMSPPLNLLFALQKYKYKKLKIVGCDHTSTIYSKGFFIDKIKYSLLKNLDYIIALTKEDDVFYKEKGLKSILIPNCIESLSLELPSDRKNIIYVGHFSDVKQPEMVVKAYYLSRLNEKGIKLKMFGHGNLLSKIMELIKEYHLQDNVEIISGENNPNVIYKDVYALLLTSKIEGFPTVLLEAIARNIPCISFDIPNGPRNIIIHEENGFLVEPNNLEEMSYFLNSEMLKNIQNRHISSTLLRYSKENILKIWLELFESLRNDKVT